jgi:hypothetical protein
MRQLPRQIHSVDHHDAAPPPHLAVLFPARTVLPFLRTPLGYNIVHPGFAIPAALALIFLPLVFWALYVGVTRHQAPQNLGHIPLIVFAIASMAASCVVFARRAIGQHHGIEIHTSEAGYSHLTWRTELPVPLCEQILVPAALMLVGWAIAHTFSFELGWWLVICGVSYLVMARWEYTRCLAQTRSTVDDMIRAQTFEDRLTRHEQQARRQPGQPQGKASPQRPHAYRDEPDMVELGGDEEPRSRPPDIATWRGAESSVTPTTMGWIRRGLGRR